MVFGAEGFELRVPLVVSPIIDPAGLQAFDIGPESGVRGDLPLLPQRVFQDYIILNTKRYRKPWVVTGATIGIGRYQSLQNNSGEVFNLLVNCHLVVQFRIEGNWIIQVSLVLGPVSVLLEVMTIRWVVKG